MNDFRSKGAGATLARLITTRPLLAFMTAIVLISACLAGARFLAPDFSYRAFFGPDDPLRQQAERFDATFGNDDSVVLLIRSPTGIMDERSADIVLRATERMWQVPGVYRVDSLSNYRWVRGDGDDILIDAMIPDEGLADTALRNERREAASDDPLIPDYLLSRDGKTTMVAGFVLDAPDQPADAASAIAGVREIAADLDDGVHEFHITGRLAIMSGMQESAQADMQSILPFVIATIILFLALAARRPGAVLIMLLLIVTSIVSTMGLAGWLGMRISSITAMVPQFILAIAVAGTVHIILGYYRERNRGHNARAATMIALERNFAPTLLAALTTSIAFMSFTLSDITAIADLGVMVGIGTLLAWVLGYLLVGSLLVLLPDLPLKTRHTGAPEEERLERHMSRYVDHIHALRYLIVAGFVIMSAAAVTIAANNSINANPFRYFDENFWLHQSSDFAETHLPGTQGIEVVLHAGEEGGVKDPEFMRRAEILQDWISAQSGVVRAVSIIDFVKQTNQALHNNDPAFFRLPDNRQELSELLFLYGFNLPEGLDLSNRVSALEDQMRISVRWTLYDSAEATRGAERIEEKAQELGLVAETTGKMLLFQRMNNYVSSSLFTSLGISLGLISLVILAVFRSARFGIASLAANALPLGFGAAVLAIAGRNIDTGAVVALTVCLGVAVDDTIHVLQSIRTSDGSCLRKQIAKGLARVFPAITLTTLILVIGFGAFVLGNFVPNQNFGLMAIVIILTTWLFDLVFLPALLMMLFPREKYSETEADSKIETSPDVEMAGSKSL